jgi:LacI family transcriptional regulator
VRCGKVKINANLIACSMKKNVSLKDIANQVGVSVSLVSYVLNGHEKKMRVGEEIARQIKETAERLHYQPNQIAKSLKSKKSQTIGLIVGEIHYRFTTGIVRAIELEAKKNGYTVVIGNSHEDLGSLRELIHVLINRQVDGLIIVAAENAESEIEYLKKKEIPFVLIDRNFPSVESNFIGIDNYRIAYRAVEYLIRQGCRRIAFVNYDTTFFHLKERSRGYLEALKDNGLAGDGPFAPGFGTGDGGLGGQTDQAGRGWLREIRKPFYEQDVAAAVRELTSPDVGCDAIFFATDTLAITGLKNLISLRVNIPKDVAFMSFDEAEAFALFQVPVTHLRQPLEEIGVSAVEMLLEEIQEGKEDNRDVKPKKWRQLYLDSTLVEGKSCRE